MGTDFWIERWKSSDTPWQQTEPEVLLTRHFPTGKVKTIFVPLCGKTMDMIWMSERGHKVLGVELSPIACRDFFEDRKIEFEKIQRGDFEIFAAQNIELWCGDFFKWEPEHLASLDLIYDRAALFALPEKIRQQYAKHMTKIITARASENFQMLLISREGMGPDHEGPPYNVTEDDVRTLYAKNFQVEVLEKIERPSRADPNIPVTETMYRLKRSLK